MKEKVKLAIPFILMGLCPVGYNLIGTSVDNEGIRHEPFFLVVLGYILFIVGVLRVITYLQNNKKRR